MRNSALPGGARPPDSGAVADAASGTVSVRRVEAPMSPPRVGDIDGDAVPDLIVLVDTPLGDQAHEALVALTGHDAIAVPSAVNLAADLVSRTVCGGRPAKPSKEEN